MWRDFVIGRESVGITEVRVLHDSYVITCIMCVHVLINSCRGVKIHGIAYRLGSVVRITSNAEAGDLPFTYVQITRIYVYQDHKIFFANKLDIRNFVKDLRAISVHITSEKLLCLSTQFYCHGVLHVKQSANGLCVIEKDHWAKHTLFY